jgi:hypothetical protein
MMELVNPTCEPISKDIGAQFKNLYEALETIRVYEKRKERKGQLDDFDQITLNKAMGESRLATSKIGRLFDDFIECECQLQEEVQLKLPVEHEHKVVSTLKEAGFDVGTDAYYEDPEHFMTLIVRRE